MKKIILLIVALLAATQGLQAGVRDDFKANVRRSASNYYAYPYPAEALPRLTPAPKGYKPFYIDHYGRHGSRWLIQERQYSFPVQQLEIAEKAGKLTARGQQVLDTLRLVQQASQGRLGELSDIGAEQHQGIAKRMFKNFPEVFAGNARVDARSTVVIRCILSMQNETDMLLSLNPKLRLTTDASQHDMYYMNYTDTVTNKLRTETMPLIQTFTRNHTHPEHMVSKLFTDAAWANANVDCAGLMRMLFDVTSNMQGHHQFEKVNFYDLYSSDNVYDLWSIHNVEWYMYAGSSPFTFYRANYNQANLLRSFIAAADSCVAKGQPSATLRFGHESVLMPLACLMGINGADYSTTDLEDLANHWQNYKIFPMGCNIQLVFYKKQGSDDVILKVLLNEAESTLPVKTDIAPYYHWKDVRAYFEDKLAREPKLDF